MTNLDLIRSALRLAKVLSEGDEPTAEQAQDGLSSLNDLFAYWDADGIDIGHYRQTSLSDDSPIYEDANLAAKYNLAMMFAGEYEVEPAPGVAAIAIDTKARLVRDKIIAENTPVDMSHLPSSDVDSDILTDS